MRQINYIIQSETLSAMGDKIYLCYFITVNEEAAVKNDKRYGVGIDMYTQKPSQRTNKERKSIDGLFRTELEAELLAQNIPYFKDVANASTSACGVVENSVEIVEKHIKNSPLPSTFTVKAVNFDVEKEKVGVEKVDKTVENPVISADFGDLPVENLKNENSLGKNTPFVENSLENVENNRKIRIAVASRYTPTMVFEGDV